MQIKVLPDLSEDELRGTVVHFGYKDPDESSLIQRYAKQHGCSYWWEGLRNDLFQAADTVKRANMVVVWNGWQYGGPLVTRLCARRGIPVSNWQSSGQETGS